MLIVLPTSPLAHCLIDPVPVHVDLAHIVGIVRAARNIGDVVALGCIIVRVSGGCLEGSMGIVMDDERVVGTDFLV